MKHYILDGHNAVPCDDLLAWAKWFEKTERHVADEVVGDVRISTVFLGSDHSFTGDPLLLFETMVFGGPHDQEWVERYSTWDEAEAGHKAMVAKVKGEMNHE